MKTKEIQHRLLFNFTKLIAPEGYPNAGYPNYNTLFGRDSLITSLQTLHMLPGVAKATLYTLVRYQAKQNDLIRDAEPGKILHEYRMDPKKQKEIPNLEWPYYGGVDSTSLFLILLKEYVDATNDTKLLYELWPNACMAARWHLDNAAKNPYGFITYERQNPRGLFHQGWKDSFEDHLKITPPVAIVEGQGYGYLAMKAYLTLLKRLGLTIVNLRHEEARNFIDTIRTNFTKHFWMEDEQYFALAIDGNGQQRKAITSNPGHLLMCGDFLEERYAKAIVERLFRKDMRTAGGIRTHSEKEPDFDPLSYHLGSVWPHDNWMIWRGCLSWGFKKEAQKIREALFRAYRVLGGIPECYAVVHGFLGRQRIVPIEKLEQLERHQKIAGRHLASFSANPIQAWSIGALLDMLIKE